MGSKNIKHIKQYLAFCLSLLFLASCSKTQTLNVDFKTYDSDKYTIEYPSNSSINDINGICVIANDRVDITIKKIVLSYASTNVESISGFVKELCKGYEDGVGGNYDWGKLDNKNGLWINIKKSDNKTGKYIHLYPYNGYIWSLDSFIYDYPDDVAVAEHILDSFKLKDVTEPKEAGKYVQGENYTINGKPYPRMCDQWYPNETKSLGNGMYEDDTKTYYLPEVLRSNTNARSHFIEGKGLAQTISIEVYKPQPYYSPQEFIDFFVDVRKNDTKFDKFIETKEMKYGEDTYFCIVYGDNIGIDAKTKTFKKGEDKTYYDMYEILNDNKLVVISNVSETFIESPEGEDFFSKIHFKR
jgi:hypothetical protein